MTVYLFPVWTDVYFKRLKNTIFLSHTREAIENSRKLLFLTSVPLRGSCYIFKANKRAGINLIAARLWNFKNCGKWQMFVLLQFNSHLVNWLYSIKSLKQTLLQQVKKIMIIFLYIWPQKVETINLLIGVNSPQKGEKASDNYLIAKTIRIIPLFHSPH